MIVRICFSLVLVLLVSCSNGSSKGKAKGSFKPPAGTQCGSFGCGGAAAPNAIQNAATTAGVVKNAGDLERELQTPTGGVKGSLTATSGIVGSAATFNPQAVGTDVGGGKNGAGASLSGGTGDPLKKDLLPGAAGFLSSLNKNPFLSNNRGNGSGDSSAGANGAGAPGVSSGGADGSLGSLARGGNGSNGLGANAATVGSAYGSGSGGGGGAGGFRGVGSQDLFGSQSRDLSGVSSQNQRFGASDPASLNPLGSADPEDYFTRLGMDDDLFKIVERRYRNTAAHWAKAHGDAVSMKAKMP